MLTNNYYAIALNEYRYAKRKYEPEYTNMTVVHVQQVIEKLFKYVIDTFCYDSDEAEQSLRSHSLSKLYVAIQSHGINLHLQVIDLRAVSNYYFDARYPGDDFMEVPTESAEHALDLMDRTMAAVQELLRNKGFCIECGCEVADTGMCYNEKCANSADDILKAFNEDMRKN
jgi:HEPN domain-containing protein